MRHKNDPAMAVTIRGRDRTGLESDMDNRTCTVDGCNKPPRSGRNAYCEMHYYRVRRGGHTGLRHKPTGRAHTTNGYLLVKVPGNPMARRSGRLKGWALEHRVILYGVIGPGVHPCHWCGRPVDWALSYPKSLDALVVDHLDGDHEHNDPSNLVPSCAACNISRTSNRAA